MKRFLLILILASTVNVFSQVEFKPGFRAGANFSRLTNTDGKSKTDFYLGGLLGIQFTKFYTLQPELTYSRQGAVVNELDYFNSYDPVITSTTKEEKYNLDYLSIGVNNKFTFGPGIQVMVGPTIDVKVGDNFPSSLSNELIGIDFTLVAGLGFEFENGIAVEGRFKQGMVDIFGDNYNENNDSNGNGNYDEVKLNQLFQVGISYSFN